MDTYYIIEGKRTPDSPVFAFADSSINMDLMTGEPPKPGTIIDLVSVEQPAADPMMLDYGCYPMRVVSKAFADIITGLAPTDVTFFEAVPDVCQEDGPFALMYCQEVCPFAVDANACEYRRDEDDGTALAISRLALNADCVEMMEDEKLRIFLLEGEAEGLDLTDCLALHESVAQKLLQAAKTGLSGFKLYRTDEWDSNLAFRDPDLSSLS